MRHREPPAAQLESDWGPAPDRAPVQDRERAAGREQQLRGPLAVQLEPGRNEAGRHAAGAARRVPCQPAGRQARPGALGLARPRAVPAQQAPPKEQLAREQRARVPTASAVPCAVPPERWAGPAPAAGPWSVAPARPERARAHAGRALRREALALRDRRPADAASSGAQPALRSPAAPARGARQAGQARGLLARCLAALRAASEARAAARALPQAVRPGPAPEAAAPRAEQRRGLAEQPGAAPPAADWQGPEHAGHPRQAQRGLRVHAARRTDVRGAAGRVDRRPQVAPGRVRRMGGAWSREPRNRPATGRRQGGWYRPEASSWYAS